jgi:hypothetical protein
MVDWNEAFITDWREVAPENPIPDSERAVEEWEEEFMHESEREYERVPAHAFWVQDFDFCDPDAINSLSRDEFDRL